MQSIWIRRNVKFARLPLQKCYHERLGRRSDLGRRVRAYWGVVESRFSWEKPELISSSDPSRSLLLFGVIIKASSKVTQTDSNLLAGYSHRGYSFAVESPSRAAYAPLGESHAERAIDGCRRIKEREHEDPSRRATSARLVTFHSRATGDRDLARATFRRRRERGAAPRA